MDFKVDLSRFLIDKLKIINKFEMHVLILPSEHFLTEWSPLGGVFQLDLARGLRRAGHQVGVLSVGKFPGSRFFRNKRYEKCEIVDGISVLRSYVEFPLPYRFGGHQLFTGIFTSLANKIYDNYVRQFGNPDIIHAHNFLYAGCVAANISVRKNVPFVVTEHSSAYSTGYINEILAKRLKVAASKASGLSAVSTPFAKILTDVLNFELSSVDVIPNSLPAEFVSAPNMPKPSSIRKEFIFLNVAELVPIKNQRLLLKAFAAGFKNTTARVRIIGDGPCKADLLQLANDLGVSNQIEMLGRLTRAQVREHIRKADSFVFSSNSETFGVVLIEALSQGLPVISTSCGGPSDIVNERNGFLVAPGNIQALTTAMCAMQNKRHLFDSMSISQECHERYGQIAVANRYIEFYRNALH